MGIATVTLSRRITAIGKYAFADASSLSMLYGDFSELARIEEGAFLDCRSFLGLDLSEAPVNIVIGERAFAGCKLKLCKPSRALKYWQRRPRGQRNS